MRGAGFPTRSPRSGLTPQSSYPYTRRAHLDGPCTGCGVAAPRPITVCSLQLGRAARVKRTFQPNNRRRARKHGFRVRMRARAGRAIIRARRKKGRARLAA